MHPDTTASLPNSAMSQAELLYRAQQRKDRQFRTNVALSWIFLLLFLLLLFSGQHLSLGPLTFKTIKIDRLFIANNLVFIAGGLGETIRISLVSITFATVLALLAALGRLSPAPPIYALSTFYVSLIRGTPLLLQIFFFFLALLNLASSSLYFGQVSLL